MGFCTQPALSLENGPAANNGFQPIDFPGPAAQKDLSFGPIFAIKHLCLCIQQIYTDVSGLYFNPFSCISDCISNIYSLFQPLKHVIRFLPVSCFTRSVYRCIKNYTAHIGGLYFDSSLVHRFFKID